MKHISRVLLIFAWMARLSFAEDSARVNAISVLDFGAVADGKTDATASFQKALDAAAQAGGGIAKVRRAAVSGNLITGKLRVLNHSEKPFAISDNATD